MNEVKGLLWYNLCGLTIIISLLLYFLGASYFQILLLTIFAGLDILVGFLYYFGIMDKLRRKQND